jgi:3-deoxy-D-manno-octulosonic-acid transferase
VSLAADAYGLAGTAAAPFLRRMLARRAARAKEVRARISERYGIASLPRPPGRLVWLHAASVGETLSILPIIDALAGEAEVLLTTGTVTSATLAAQRLPAHARHQFAPLDVPGWVAAFMAHWRPNIAVFAESELWPTMIAAIDAAGIARLLVNASMSDKSTARWRKIAKFAETMVFGFRYIHVQSGRDAANLKSLGAAGILEWGNLKYAAPLLPYDEAALAALKVQIPGPVWLAASTHPGEEAIIIAAHEILRAAFPGLITIIVPRHPARGAEFSFPRRSLGQPPVAGQPYIADTLGELGLFYRASPFAFIGGSLVPIGGHNLTEAARLGLPVITGPYTSEIPEQIERLRAAGGLAEVVDGASLAAAVAHWLNNPDAAREAGAGAPKAFAGLEDLPQRLASLILANCI